jgi:hypothetical protein
MDPTINNNTTANEVPPILRVLRLIICRTTFPLNLATNTRANRANLWHICPCAEPISRMHHASPIIESGR